MLLSLSGKIYSRSQGPRGQRMHMWEVYLGKKKFTFSFKEGGNDGVHNETIHKNQLAGWERVKNN